METVFNWNNYSKKQDDLHIICYLEGELLYCCEYTDNQHDYQMEIKCRLKDFAIDEKESVMKCKSFIIKHFGLKALEEIEIKLKEERG